MTLHKAWSIGNAYEHLAGIYGDANALTTPQDERFIFLGAACGDLSRCYRKKLEALYPIALAQLTAWHMSVAEGLFRSAGSRILASAMARKYPEGHCGYCNFLPCQCDEKRRPPHSGGMGSPQQLQWSLSEWQEHLYDLYGRGNKDGGIPKAINRLFEEISEIGLVLRLADGHNDSLNDIRKKIALEMTDVLAWILGVSSLLDIDLAQALVRVYGAGCPVCKRPSQCDCRHFERRPLSGTYTHRFMQAEEILATLKAA